MSASRLTPEETLIKHSVITAFAALALVGAAQAQNYPTKPITWVVPFTAGGITDSSARAVGQRLGRELGQTIVIENKPGAGGMLGTEYVMNAPADGYTILYGTAGTLGSNLALYKNVRYKPERDFVAVHAMFETPTILAVNAAKPYKSVKDIVDKSKASPSSVYYGSAGAGTGTHLTSELFQMAAGIKMVHVPYKGSAPALNDLLGGTFDLMFDYPITVGPHIKTGKLRALAVTSAKRLPQFPDLPTIGELGYPQAEAVSWSGVFVPAGTPEAIVKRLQAAMHVAMTDPDVVKPIEANGSTALSNLQGAEFTAFVAKEQVKWIDVVKRSGATAD